MTQFNLTLTRSVTGCGEKLEGRVEVIATPTTVIDEQQRYVLESNGWWATSDITSNLAASGISTGLNAQSADATGTVISNIVATFGKVLVGAVSAGGRSKSLDKKELCRLAVRTAVDSLYPLNGKRLKEIVEEDTAKLATATAKLTLMSALAQARRGYKEELEVALKEQEVWRKSLTDNQKKMTEALKLTSDTQVVNWPIRADHFRRDEPFSLAAATLARWMGIDTETEAGRKWLSDVYPNERGKFDVYLALYRQVSNPTLPASSTLTPAKGGNASAPVGDWILPSPPETSNVTIGVPVRLARTGRLLICVEEVCPPSIPAAGIKNPNITGADQTVLQMGQLYTVPLTGGTFRSQAAVIALDTNGLPATIQVSEKVAGAVALTGTAKDVATQLAALPADIRAAELARIKSKTDVINAQSALATAQANLAVSDQTSGLAAQTALINAQTGLATAQINAGFPLQTAALTAQINLLNAQAGQATAQISTQTALLNAQAALATAQANAAVVDQTSVLGAQAALINAQTALLNAAAALAKANTVVP